MDYFLSPVKDENKIWHFLFPNPDQLVIDPFFPREGITHVLQVWLGLLPAWDMEAVDFFGYQREWLWKLITFVPFEAIWVHGIV